MVLGNKSPAKAPVKVGGRCSRLKKSLQCPVSPPSLPVQKFNYNLTLLTRVAQEVMREIYTQMHRELCSNNWSVNADLGSDHRNFPGLIFSFHRLQKKCIPWADGVGSFSRWILLLRVSRSKPQMSHPFAGELFGAAETKTQTWRVNMSPKHGRGCEMAKYGATFRRREASNELWTASFPKPHWQETALPAIGEEGQTLQMMVPVRLSVLQLSN